MKIDAVHLENKLEKLLREELLRLEEMKRGSEEVTYLPNHIYVEPTNMCNLECATCTPKEIKGKRGKLSMRVWKDIVDYLESKGANPAITLIGRGEPLMHPEIGAIVRYASERGFSCYIITNGTLLDLSKAVSLLDAGLSRIQFSLHATTAETYEKMTGKALFSETVKNITEFIKLNDDRGHRCHVSVFSVTSAINRHEMEDFKSFWAGKVDRVHMHDYFSLHGDSRMAIGTRAHKRNAGPSGGGAGGCSIPWWFFTVRWDGAIVPCALDHASRIVVEKIYNEAGEIDLLTAWNSELYRTLRRAEAKEDYGALKCMGYDCENCEARLNPRTFNDRERYVSGFARHFALQFIPAIKTSITQ